MPEYYTRKQVANHFGVTQRTVLNWERSKILQSLKIGGKRYYSKSEVHSLLPREEVSNG